MSCLAYRVCQRGRNRVADQRCDLFLGSEENVIILEPLKPCSLSEGDVPRRPRVAEPSARERVEASSDCRRRAVGVEAPVDLAVADPRGTGAVTRNAKLFREVLEATSRGDQVHASLVEL